MTSYGYFLSSEEFTPGELIKQAQMAEQAGFDVLAISDHYHPWNNEQGQSAFVWSTIGAISQVTSLPITSFVTCPTMRTHPAVVAQAAATSGVITGGKFRFGVGTGEALNEHILGDRWPPAPVRMEMLEEAIDIIRRLFTGKQISHHGKYYTVENARLYTVPQEPVPIHISGLGRKAASLAGRIGDGFITIGPNRTLIEEFRKSGGADKPVIGGTKVCWAHDREEAVRTVHRLWPTEQLPGELLQVLPTPKHFEQASQLVTPQMIDHNVTCGNDAEEHLNTVRAFTEADFDEVYIAQIGPDQRAFFDAYGDRILPQLRSGEHDAR
jgi:G6PDH family F420-dependent oxidoreductase